LGTPQEDERTRAVLSAWQFGKKKKKKNQSVTKGKSPSSKQKAEYTVNPPRARNGNHTVEQPQSGSHGGGLG
jgi:hypothetical protein